MKTRFLRAASWFVCFSFSLTSLNPVSFAMTPEVSSVPFKTLAIPSEFGQVTDITAGSPGAPAFIHIQSAHGNYAAEKNIENLLGFIEKNSKVRTVLLEGAASKLQPELFRLFPKDPGFNRKVTDKLMQEGYLTGPERFLIENAGQASRAKGHKSGDVARGSWTGFGIEDLSAYKKDRDAFIKVVRADKQTQKFLMARRADLSKHFASKLNKDLLTFVRQGDAFDSEALSFEAWLKVLEAASAKHLRMDLADTFNQVEWPFLVRYERLHSIGSKIDSQKARTEAQSFLKELEKRKISQDIISSFKTILAKPEAELFKAAGKSANSYSSLRLAFDKAFGKLPKDFSMKAWPNWTLYAQYGILTQELEGKGLHEEVARLKEKILDVLAKTADEKAYVAQTRELNLLRKLFALELTRGEYEEIRDMSHEPRATDKTPGTNHALRTTWPVELGSWPEAKALVASAMDFYATAVVRENKMFTNALQKMSERKDKNAVIVTGGFHAEGLKKLAALQGCAYMQITPRIDEISKRDHEVYLRSILGVRDFESSQMSAWLLSNWSAMKAYLAGQILGAKQVILGEVSLQPVSDQPGFLAALNSSLLFGDVVTARSESRKSTTPARKLAFKYDFEGKTFYDRTLSQEKGGAEVARLRVLLDGVDRSNSDNAGLMATIAKKVAAFTLSARRAAANEIDIAVVAMQRTQLDAYKTQLKVFATQKKMLLEPESFLQKADASRSEVRKLKGAEFYYNAHGIEIHDPKLTQKAGEEQMAQLSKILEDVDGNTIRSRQAMIDVAQRVAEYSLSARQALSAKVLASRRELGSGVSPSDKTQIDVLAEQYRLLIRPDSFFITETKTAATRSEVRRRNEENAGVYPPLVPRTAETGTVTAGEFYDAIMAATGKDSFQQKPMSLAPVSAKAAAAEQIAFALVQERGWSYLDEVARGRSNARKTAFQIGRQEPVSKEEIMAFFKGFRHIASNTIFDISDSSQHVLRNTAMEDFFVEIFEEVEMAKAANRSEARAGAGVKVTGDELAKAIDKVIYENRGMAGIAIDSFNKAQGLLNEQQLYTRKDVLALMKKHKVEGYVISGVKTAFDSLATSRSEALEGAGVKVTGKELAGAILEVANAEHNRNLRTSTPMPASQAYMFSSSDFHSYSAAAGLLEGDQLYTREKVSKLMEKSEVADYVTDRVMTAFDSLAARITREAPEAFADTEIGATPDIRAEIEQLKSDVAAFQKKLTPAKLKNLSGKQIGKWSEWQVQALTAKQIQAFDQKQIQALTVKQMQRLTLEQTQGLYDSGAVRWLTVDRVDALRQRQVQLPVSLRTFDQVRSLTEKRTHELTVPEIIGRGDLMIQLLTPQQKVWLSSRIQALGSAQKAASRSEVRGARPWAVTTSTGKELGGQILAEAKKERQRVVEYWIQDGVPRDELPDYIGEQFSDREFAAELFAGEKRDFSKAEAVAFLKEHATKEHLKYKATVHTNAVYAPNVKDVERTTNFIADMFDVLVAIKNLQDSLEIYAQHFSLKTGAATGSIAPHHLEEIGVTASLVGHSERRTRLIEVYDMEKTSPTYGTFLRHEQQYGDTEEVINQKLKLAAKGETFKELLCFGEPRSIRDAGDDEAIRFVLRQLKKAFQDMSEKDIRNALKGLRIAYEPIWAINTGLNATADQAQTMHQAIREWLSKTYSPELAREMTILYGGSAKPTNVEELLEQPDVDGFLVGGASLKLESFSEMGQIMAGINKGNGRKPILAANWKAEPQGKRTELNEFIAGLAAQEFLQQGKVGIIIAPPHTLLDRAVTAKNAAIEKLATGGAVRSEVRKILDAKVALGISEIGMDFVTRAAYEVGASLAVLNSHISERRKQGKIPMVHNGIPSAAWQEAESVIGGKSANTGALSVVGGAVSKRSEVRSEVVLEKTDHIPGFRDVPRGQLFLGKYVKLYPLAIQFFKLYGGKVRDHVYGMVRNVGQLLWDTKVAIGDTKDPYYDLDFTAKKVVLNRDFVDFLNRTGRKKIFMSYLAGAVQKVHVGRADVDTEELEVVLAASKQSLVLKHLGGRPKTRLDDVKALYDLEKKVLASDEENVMKRYFLQDQDIQLLISDILLSGKTLDAGRLQRMLIKSYGYYGEITEKKAGELLQAFHKAHENIMLVSEVVTKDNIEKLKAKLVPGAQIQGDFTSALEQLTPKTTIYGLKKEFVSDPAFHGRNFIWDVEAERQDEVNFGGKSAQTGELMYAEHAVTLPNFFSHGELFQNIFAANNLRRDFIPALQARIQRLRAFQQTHAERLKKPFSEIDEAEHKALSQDLRVFRVLLEEDEEAGSPYAQIDQFIATAEELIGDMKNFEGATLKEFFEVFGKKMDEKAKELAGRKSVYETEQAQLQGELDKLQKEAIKLGAFASAEITSKIQSLQKQIAALTPLIKEVDLEEKIFTTKEAERFLVASRNFVLNDEIVSEMKDYLRQLAERLGIDVKGLVLAIRSSGVGEDGETASFAGRQDTYIFVTPGKSTADDPDGLNAMVESWIFNQASLFNKRAISYRFKHALPTFDSHAEISTLFQEMFLSTISFIAFSVDRGTGFGAHSIQAMEGQGEMLVSGKESGSQFVITYDGRRLTGAIGVRKFKVVETPDGKGKVTVPVPLKEAAEFAITDHALLKESARYFTAIHEFYGGSELGGYMDLEGAWRPKTDENGKPVYLKDPATGEVLKDERGNPRLDWTIVSTQARPETVISMQNPDIIKLRRIVIPDAAYQKAEKAGKVLSFEFIAKTGGTAQGEVAFIFNKRDPEELAKAQGKIMVTMQSDPDMESAMTSAKGIIAILGGQNSHTMIVATEFGLIAITGTKAELLKFLKEGDKITLDAERGKIVLGYDHELRVAGNDFSVRNIPNTDPGAIRSATIVATVNKAMESAALSKIPSDEGIGLTRLELVLKQIGIYPDLLMAYDNYMAKKEGRPYDPNGPILDPKIAQDRKDIKLVKEWIHGFNSGEDFYTTILSEFIRAMSETLKPPMEEVLLRAQKIQNDKVRAQAVKIVRDYYAKNQFRDLEPLESLVALEKELSSGAAEDLRNLQDVTRLLNKWLKIRLDDRKSDEYEGIPGATRFVKKETNPMKGLRGLELLLSTPTLRWQLRAIAKVAHEGHGKLGIFVPVVRRPQAVKEWLKIMDEEGLTKEFVKRGIMTEIPINALLIKKFLATGIDFISTGGNDGEQTVNRKDRNASDSFLAEMGGDFSKAALRWNAVIGQAVKEYNEENKTHIEAGFCGNAPSVRGQDDYAIFLRKVGYGSVSVVVEQYEGVTNRLVQPDHKARPGLLDETEFKLEIDPDVHATTVDASVVKIEDLRLGIGFHYRLLLDQAHGKLTDTLKKAKVSRQERGEILSAVDEFIQKQGISPNESGSGRRAYKAYMAKKILEAFKKAQKDKLTLLIATDDATSDQYRALLGGRFYEPKEANPELGVRGFVKASNHDAAFTGWDLEVIAELMKPFNRILNQNLKAARKDFKAAPLNGEAEPESLRTAGGLAFLLRGIQDSHNGDVTPEIKRFKRMLKRADLEEVPFGLDFTVAGNLFETKEIAESGAKFFAVSDPRQLASEVMTKEAENINGHPLTDGEVREAVEVPFQILNTAAAKHNIPLYIGGLVQPETGNTVSGQGVAGDLDELISQVVRRNSSGRALIWDFLQAGVKAGFFTFSEGVAGQFFSKGSNNKGDKSKRSEMRAEVLPEAEWIEIAQDEVAIKRAFGTNGIRSDDIEIDGQRRIAAGTAVVLAAQWRKANPGKDLPWVMVGFDPRPQGAKGFTLGEMGESKAVAEVFAAYGFKVLFVPKAVAAPFMISASGKNVHPRDIFAAAMRTASHNEVVDPTSGRLVSGFKLFMENAPAADSFTGLISTTINDKEFAAAVPLLHFNEAVEDGRIVVSQEGDKDDPDTVEFRRMQKAFDLSRIGTKFRERFPEFQIAINTMNGGMSQFGSRVLEEMGFVKNKGFWAFNTTLMNDPSMKEQMTGWREYQDPNTGATKRVRFAPDPTRSWMRGKEYTDFVAQDPMKTLALLIDGDADRLVAELGKEIIPNEIGMLAAYYLAKYKGQKGRIVRTVPTTGGLDALAQALGLGEVAVTPVGSKWFAGPNQYYDSDLTDVLVAVEESGHIVFNKKGQLFFDHSIGLATLMLEMMAETGKTWQELSVEMWSFIEEKTGQKRIATVRGGIAKDEGAENYYALVSRLGNKTEDAFRREFADKMEATLVKAGLSWKVVNMDITDAGGAQLQFEGGRKVFPRKSGTDGSVRLYGEVLETELDLVPVLVTSMRAVMDSFVAASQGVQVVSGEGKRDPSPSLTGRSEVRVSEARDAEVAMGIQSAYVPGVDLVLTRVKSVGVATLVEPRGQAGFFETKNDLPHATQVAAHRVLRWAHNLGDKNKFTKNLADGETTYWIREYFNRAISWLLGVVVIGEGERDDAPMLYIGELVGTALFRALGNAANRLVDIAIDVLELTNGMVRDSVKATVSIAAYARKGGLMNAPDFYISKWIVGPKAKGQGIDVEKPTAENIKILSGALGKSASQLKGAILFRSIHVKRIVELIDAGIDVGNDALLKDLVQKVHAKADQKELDAAFKTLDKAVKEVGIYRVGNLYLLADGDLTPVFALASPDDYEYHLDFVTGRGGAPEGVLAGVVAKAIGGEISARFVSAARLKEQAIHADLDRDGLNFTKEEISRFHKFGFNDPGVPGSARRYTDVFKTDDLVPADDFVVIASAVKENPWVPGLQKPEFDFATGEFTGYTVRASSSGRVELIKTTYDTLVKDLRAQLQEIKGMRRADETLDLQSLRGLSRSDQLAYSRIAYQLGRVYLVYQRFDEAAALFKKAQALEQRSSEGQYYEAAYEHAMGLKALLKGEAVDGRSLKGGDALLPDYFEVASAHFAKSLSLSTERRDPQFRTREILVGLNVFRGETAFKAKRWDLARGYLQRVIKRDPENLEAAKLLSELPSTSEQNGVAAARSELRAVTAEPLQAPVVSFSETLTKLKVSIKGVTGTAKNVTGGLYARTILATASAKAALLELAASGERSEGLVKKSMETAMMLLGLRGATDSDVFVLGNQFFLRDPRAAAGMRKLYGQATLMAIVTTPAELQLLEDLNKHFAKEGLLPIVAVDAKDVAGFRTRLSRITNAVVRPVLLGGEVLPEGLQKLLAKNQMIVTDRMFNGFVAAVDMLVAGLVGDLQARFAMARSA